MTTPTPRPPSPLWLLRRRDGHPVIAGHDYLTVAGPDDWGLAAECTPRGERVDWEILLARPVATATVVDTPDPGEPTP